MEKYITKEDGKEEAFKEEKIRKSLLNSGTDPDVVNSATSKIKSRLNEIIKSEDIYRLVLDHLKKKQPGAAIKYTLKKAIMKLGPAGYIFEKYFAKILEAHGFKTKVSCIMKGFCVDHEVDVVAEKNNKHIMVECKYHNDLGTKSDIKTVLYVHSRFADIKKACVKDINSHNFSEVWLATNTKCTSEAIKYAECMKMGVVAWHYPQKKNLEDYIESKKLYPVSILPGLKEYNKNKLFDSNILTIQDFLENTPDLIAKALSINKSKTNKLFAEAALLMT